MTAQTDELDIRLQIQSRPFKAQEMELRQIILGYEPLALIEIDMDNSTDTEMLVKLDATGFTDDHMALASMLRVIADEISRAVKSGELPDVAEDEGSALDD